MFEFNSPMFPGSGEGDENQQEKPKVITLTQPGVAITDSETEKKKVVPLTQVGTSFDDQESLSKPRTVATVRKVVTPAAQTAAVPAASDELKTVIDRFFNRSMTLEELRRQAKEDAAALEKLQKENTLPKEEFEKTDSYKKLSDRLTVTALALYPGTYKRYQNSPDIDNKFKLFAENIHKEGRALTENERAAELNKTKQEIIYSSVGYDPNNTRPVDFWQREVGGDPEGQKAFLEANKLGASTVDGVNLDLSKVPIKKLLERFNNGNTELKDDSLRTALGSKAETRNYTVITETPDGNQNYKILTGVKKWLDVTDIKELTGKELRTEVFKKFVRSIGGNGFEERLIRLNDGKGLYQDIDTGEDIEYIEDSTGLIEDETATAIPYTDRDNLTATQLKILKLFPTLSDEEIKKKVRATLNARYSIADSGKTAALEALADKSADTGDAGFWESVALIADNTVEWAKSLWYGTYTRTAVYGDYIDSDSEQVARNLAKDFGVSDAFEDYVRLDKELSSNPPAFFEKYGIRDIDWDKFKATWGEDAVEKIKAIETEILTGIANKKVRISDAKNKISSNQTVVDGLNDFFNGKNDITVKLGRRTVTVTPKDAENAGYIDKLGIKAVNYFSQNGVSGIQLLDGTRAGITVLGTMFIARGILGKLGASEKAVLVGQTIASGLSQNAEIEAQGRFVQDRRALNQAKLMSWTANAIAMGGGKILGNAGASSRVQAAFQVGFEAEQALEDVATNDYYYDEVDVVTIVDGKEVKTKTKVVNTGRVFNAFIMQITAPDVIEDIFGQGGLLRARFTHMHSAIMVDSETGRKGAFFVDPSNGDMTFKILSDKQYKKLESNVRLEQNVNSADFDQTYREYNHSLVNSAKNLITNGNVGIKLNDNKLNDFFPILTPDGKISTIKQAVMDGEIPKGDFTTVITDKEGKTTKFEGPQAAMDLYTDKDEFSLMKLLSESTNTNFSLTRRDLLLSKKGEKSLQSSIFWGYVKEDGNGRIQLTQKGRDTLSNLEKQSETFAKAVNSYSDEVASQVPEALYSADESQTKPKSVTNESTEISEKLLAKITDPGLNEAVSKALLVPNQPVNFTALQLSMMDEKSRDALAAGVALNLLNFNQETGAVTNQTFASVTADGQVINFGIKGYADYLSYKYGEAINAGNYEEADTTLATLAKFKQITATPENLGKLGVNALTDYDFIQQKISNSDDLSIVNVEGPLKYRTIDEYYDANNFQEIVEEPSTTGPGQATTAVYPGVSIHSTPQTAINWRQANQTTPVPDNFQFRSSDMRGRQSFSKNEDGTWSDSAGKIYSERNLQNMFGQTNAEIGLQNVATTVVSDQQAQRDNSVPMGQRSPEDFNFLAPGEVPTILPAEFVLSASDDDGNFMLLHLVRDSETGNYVMQNYKPGQVVSESSVREYIAEGNTKLGTLKNPSVAPEFGGVSPKESVKSPTDAKTLSEIKQRIRENFSETEKLIIQTASLSADKISTNNSAFAAGKGVIWLDNKTSIRIGVDDSGNNFWGSNSEARLISSKETGVPLHWGNRSFMNLYLGNRANVDLINATIVAVEDAEYRLSEIQEMVDAGLTAEDIANSFGVTEKEFTTYQTFLKNVVDNGEIAVLTKVDAKQLMNSDGVRDGKITAANKLQTATTEEILHKALADAVLKQTGRRYLLGDPEFKDAIIAKLSDPNSALAKFLKSSDGHYANRIKGLIDGGQEDFGYDQFIHELMAKSNSEEGLGRDFGATSKESLDLHADAVIEVIETMMDLGIDVPNTFRAFAEPNISAKIETLYEAKRINANVAETGRNSQEGRTNAERRMADLGQAANTEQGTTVQRNLDASRVDAEQGVTDPSIPNDGSIYSMDYDAIDRHSLINQAQMDESTKAHESGSGIVHISQTLKIDLDSSVDGPNGIAGVNFSETAPAFGVVDTPRRLVMNESMKNLILDLYNPGGQLAATNPQVKILRRYLRGFTAESKIGLARTLVSKLLVDLQTAGPISKNYSFEQITAFLNLMSQFSGMTVKELAAPITAAESQTFLNSREPGILLGYNRQSGTFNDFRNVLKHEDTHATLRELGLPAKWAYSKAALDIVGRNPRFQELYKKIINRQLSAYQGANIDTVVHEVFAFGTNSADAMYFDKEAGIWKPNGPGRQGYTNLGYNPAEFKEYASLYAAMTHALANEFGVDSAKAATRYADFGLYDHINNRVITPYGTNLPQFLSIGSSLINGETSEFGGLYSMDAGPVSAEGDGTYDQILAELESAFGKQVREPQPVEPRLKPTHDAMFDLMARMESDPRSIGTEPMDAKILTYLRLKKTGRLDEGITKEMVQGARESLTQQGLLRSKDPDTTRAMLDTDTARLVHDSRPTRKQTTLKLVGLTVNGMDLDNPNIPRPVAEAIANYVANGGSISNQKFNYKIPAAIQGVIAAESFIPQRIDKGLPLWTVGFFDELPLGPLKVRPKYANTELAKYDGVELTPENTREIQQAVLKQHAANVATNEQALEWLKNNPLSVAVPAMRLTLDPATAVREVDEAFRLATENNPEFERVMLGHYDEFADWVKTNSEIVATQKLDRQGAIIGRRVDKAMGVASPADKAVFYEGPQIYSMDAEQVSEGVQQFQQEYYRASTLTGNHRTFQVNGKPVTNLDSLPKLVADEFRAVMANPDGPFTEEFGSMITNKLKGRATQLTDSIDFATGKLGKGADIVTGNTHTIIGVRGEVTVDPATGKATIKGGDLNGTTVDNVQAALDMLINQHVENSTQELAENANTMKFLTTKNWDVVHNTTIPKQALVKSASDLIGGLGKSVFPNLKDGMPALYSMDAGSVAPVKNIDEDGFYSNLVNFLDTGRIPDKAIAKDWLALIQKAPGVKKEEVEWNGVLSWLNENPRASLTKEEVRDYAMKHRVKAEFITLQRPPIALSNARSQAAKEVSRTAADMQSAVSTYENEKSLGIISPELLSQLKTEQDEAVERHRIAKEKYAEADRVWAEAQDRVTQYEQYVLDGDYYNYKELLMTIPNPVKGETGRIFSVQDLPYNHFLTRNPNSGLYRVHVGKPGLVESRDVTGYHPTEQGALRDFFFNRHSPGLTTFGGPSALGQSHFTEIPAVTAFSRVSGRTMSSTNDTFFIEEVQSDTHQNGSVRGYFNPPNVQQIQTLVHEAFNAYGRYIENSEQLQKIFTPESLFNRLAQSQFGGRDVPRAQIFDEIIFEVTRLQNPSPDVAIAAAKESPVWLSTILKSKGVDPVLAETNGLEIFKVLLEARNNFEVFVNKKADAISLRTQQNAAFRAQTTTKGTPVLETPFAKNWVAVLLKRAMRMAVEQGKTNFAWAPSEIHLERWATALRSNIDRFEYHRPSLVQDANTPRFSELTGSRLRSAQSQADIDSLVKDYDELTEGSTPANAEYRAKLREEVIQAKEEYDAALKQDSGTYDSEKQILDAERKYITRINAINYYDNIYGDLADNPQGVTITGYKNGREVFTQTLPLNGTTTINNQQVSLNQLVGNNVANQIRANKIGIITGDNLSVGGEFYKNVYDRLMVKEANALLSKYGVQVEKAVLNPGTADEISVWGFEIPEAFAQSVRDQGLPLYSMDAEVRAQSEIEIADAKRLISERYGKTLNPFREVSARVDLVHGTPDMTVQLMSDNMKYGQGVILSPEKKGKNGFSESENLARVEELRRDLTAAKIRFTEVTGKWTNPETAEQEIETSFHITGTTNGVEMFGQILAKKYKQDAYISYHRGTFTYHDLVKNTKVQTSNYSFNPDVTSEDSDLDGSYMDIGGKQVSFVADFDWSQSTKREPLNDTRMGSYYRALLKLYGVDVATESEVLDIDKAPTLTLPDGRVVPTKDVVVDTVTRTPVGLVTERGSDGFATKWMPFDSALEQFPFLGDENNTVRPQTFGLKNNLIAAKTKETLVNPITGEPLVDETGNPRLATKVPGVSIFGKALTPTGKPDYGKQGTPPPQGATRFVSLGNGLSDKNPQWAATAAMQNKLLELNTRNGVDIPKRPTVTRDQDPGAWAEYEGQLTAFTENSIEAVVRRKIAANGGKFIPPTFYISGKRVTWNNSRFEVEGYDADANNLLTSAIFAATSQMRGVKTNAREASFILSAMAALTEDTEGDVIFIPKMRQVIVDGKPTYEPELHTEGPKKGQPIKFGVATLALTKIDLATRGYRYVDAREAARLRKQGVKVEKATNVLAGENALINEFAVPKGTKEGAFLCVKDELLTKLVNTHGPVVGLMEYVLTPDADNLNLRAHSLFGDKIGSFFLNLAGHVNQVTIDRHMHRWWLKLTGQAITDITYDKNGYITGFKDNTLGDVPEKNADLLRGAIQKTAANLSREFGITVTPRDVQQIIWNETVNTNRAWAELTPAQMESGDYDDIYLSTQYSEGLPLPVSELISNGKLEKMLAPKSGTIPDAFQAHSDGSLDRLFMNAQRSNLPELFSADANDSLRAQQDIINLSEPLLNEADADTWIAAAERLVAGNTAATMRGQSLLAESEKRAIKLLAEKGDVEGLQKYVLSLNKQTPLELFVNLGRVTLLLGTRTVVKNALGNTIRQVMDEVARVPASLLDTVFIHFNKLLGGKNLDKSTRSLLTNPLATLDAYKAALGGAGKEGVQQLIDVLRGKNQDIIFEHPSLFREKTTGWKILKPLEILEKYGWRIQGAMDKPFNAMAYHRSLREMQQMRYREQIQAGNQITLAEAEDYLTPMDFQLAEEYALAATYQQNNTISDKYYTFVDGLPPTWRAIITNVVKFVKTPLNVMDYVLDYSGIWPIAKLAHAEFNTPDWVNWKTTAKKVLDTPESRKVMSMAISQGAIGSLMMYIGFEMAKAGLLSGWYDKEERKEQEQMEAKGTSAGKVNIGGYSIDVSWLSPNSFWLTAGAANYQSYKDYDDKLADLEQKLATATEQENQDKITEYTEALNKHKASSPAEQLLSRMLKNFALQTPFLRQMNDVVEAWNTDTTFSTLAGKWMMPDMFPGIFKEIAEAKDKYERVVPDDSFLQTTLGRFQKNMPTIPGIADVGKTLEETKIPGISQFGKILTGRENLPAKVDMFGRPIPTAAGLSGPFRAQQLPQDLLANELDRFNLTITKPKGATSTAENELRRIKGEAFTPVLQSVVESEQYKNVPDAYKKRMLEYAIRSVTTEQRKDKFSPEEEKFNIQSMLNRESFKSNLVNNPDMFKKPLTVTDKEIIRSFAGANLPTSISMSDIIAAVRKEGVDKFIDDKFMFEMNVNDRQTAAQAQANYEEFQKNPQLALIRWYAASRRNAESRDRLKDRRTELLSQGKSKEEVEKIIRKESSKVGAETRLKVKRTSKVTITP